MCPRRRSIRLATTATERPARAHTDGGGHVYPWRSGDFLGDGEFRSGRRIRERRPEREGDRLCWRLRSRGGRADGGGRPTRRRRGRFLGSGGRCRSFLALTARAGAGAPTIGPAGAYRSLGASLPTPADASIRRNRRFGWRPQRSRNEPAGAGASRARTSPSAERPTRAAPPVSARAGAQASRECCLPDLTASPDRPNPDGGPGRLLLQGGRHCSYRRPCRHL